MMLKTLASTTPVPKVFFSQGNWLSYFCNISRLLSCSQPMFKDKRILLGLIPSSNQGSASFRSIKSEGKGWRKMYLLLRIFKERSDGSGENQGKICRSKEWKHKGIGVTGAEGERRTVFSYSIDFGDAFSWLQSMVTLTQKPPYCTLVSHSSSYLAVLCTPPRCSVDLSPGSYWSKLSPSAYLFALLIGWKSCNLRLDALLLFYILRSSIVLYHVLEVQIKVTEWICAPIPWSFASSVYTSKKWSHM